MAEKCVDRLQRLIDEKHKEQIAARDTKLAAIKAAKLAELASQNIEKEMDELDAEMDSLTDEELKLKSKDYLHKMLSKAKELEEEKSRRSGG